MKCPDSWDHYEDVVIIVIINVAVITNFTA